MLSFATSHPCYGSAGPQRHFHVVMIMNKRFYRKHVTINQDESVVQSPSVKCFLHRLQSSHVSHEQNVSVCLQWLLKCML